MEIWIRIEEEEVNMKTLEEYLKLPYTIEMIQQSTGSWFVAIKELPGCISQGDTPEDAVAMIHDAMRAWIEVALEDGMPVPEPQADEEYSGRFMVRVPRSLHRQLVQTADRQGVSLNAYCIAVLAQASGQPAEGKQAFPGLADAMVRFLKGAGADFKEDQSLEEKLANWMNSELGEIKAMVEVGKIEEARTELIYLSKGLQKAGKKSATFQSLAKFVLFAQQILSSRLPNQPVVETEHPIKYHQVNDRPPAGE
jgi:antitoxin HicB